MTPPCPWAACRSRAGETVAPVPFSDRHADAFNARSRALLGLPAVADLSELPADVRGFVEEL